MAILCHVTFRGIVVKSFDKEYEGAYTQDVTNKTLVMNTTTTKNSVTVQDGKFFAFGHARTVIRYAIKFGDVDMYNLVLRMSYAAKDDDLSQCLALYDELAASYAEEMRLLKNFSKN